MLPTNSTLTPSCLIPLPSLTLTIACRAACARPQSQRAVAASFPHLGLERGGRPAPQQQRERERTCPRTLSPSKKTGQRSLPASASLFAPLPPWSPLTSTDWRSSSPARRTSTSIGLPKLKKEAIEAGRVRWLWVGEAGEGWLERG